MKNIWGSRPKYGNRKITIGGETFDSQKEYNRWCELRLMEKAGLIKDLRRQEKFILIPSQRIDGKVAEREVAYYADFTYLEKVGLGEWKKVVEDAKGMRTEKYIIKRKLMLYVYGIQVKEV